MSESKTFSEMDDAGLVSELVSRQHELVRARFAHSMNQLENTAALRVVRKDIARIQTELRRRELAEGLPKNTLMARHQVDPATVRGGESAGSGEGFLAGVVDKLAD